MRSIKEECLNRVVVLGEGHLRLVIREYVEQYHRERNHQGLNNKPLERAPPPASPDAEVHRRERIGALLNYYHREVAREFGPFNAPYGESQAKILVR